MRRNEEQKQPSVAISIFSLQHKQSRDVGTTGMVVVGSGRPVGTANFPTGVAPSSSLVWHPRADWRGTQLPADEYTWHLVRVLLLIRAHLNGEG